MRRPTLARWLRRELLALAGAERFSLRKLAAMAQGRNARLRAPLFLYCREENRLEELRGLLYREDVVREYEAASKQLGGADLTALALSGAASQRLPKEYSKHLDSFAADYRRPEADAASKRMRLERCRALQLQKGAGATELSRALGLDAGNVCAFLKGDLGRLTLADATAMMKHLMAL